MTHPLDTMIEAESIKSGLLQHLMETLDSLTPVELEKLKDLSGDTVALHLAGIILTKRRPALNTAKLRELTIARAARIKPT